jgi:hypothetical protein
MATTGNGKIIGWTDMEKQELRVMIDQLRHHPERHVHRFREELEKCCKVNGQFAPVLLELHYIYSKIHNANNDPCDVLEGPCTCGAWHDYGTPY